MFSLPRLQDQKIDFEVQITTWSDDSSGKGGHPAPTGLERLVVLAMKRDATGLTPDLCALAQSSLDARMATRSAGDQTELDELIGDIVSTGTRAASLLQAGTAAPKVSMESYMLELDVAP